MIYRITYVEGKRKFAHPVKSREELMALRNSPENLRNLAKARQGDQEAKMRLLQLAYNLGHVDGAIAGCKSIGSYFFHDVDCYDAEHSEQTKELILSKKDEIGLKCLERSASGGWHLVCQRVPGTTILENQVRVASILQIEMDTSAKDLQRVVFSTSGSEEDLVYLDDCLFSEPMSPEQCEEEYKRLKVRVLHRKEQVPPGAKKANKHYRPWEEIPGNVMGDSFRVENSKQSLSVGTGVAGTHGYDAETLSASKDGTANHDGAAGQKTLPLKIGGVPPQEGREYDDADVNILPRRCATPPLPKGGSPMGSSPQETSLTAGEDTQKTLPLKLGGVPPQGGREYDNPQNNTPNYPTEYHGIPFSTILNKYWELNNRGFEPSQGDRDTLTYQLACDLRHICGKSFEWLDEVIPCYNGFTLEEKQQKIKSALNSEYESFPARLRKVLDALQVESGKDKTEAGETDNLDDDEQLSIINRQLSMTKMPQGIKDSIEAVGPNLTMPVITAICPAIGALATGVQLDVHGKKRGLNIIAYIAGDFASKKGDIDPVVDAWMNEVKALDKMYLTQEDEWRAKKRAAKNKKEQPEEPKLPVRCLTLNNTVANLAERLANTDGKHAFSFTPEADTVSQKWKSTMSDFSIMLRQSYDGTRYDREARSADAVNVHIDKLLWNVTMCGTPDALYRVVNNYTDGFQSRIAIARTPDNTYTALEDNPTVLTNRQEERIKQIAHLLPLMQGEIELTKLENKGREWLETIRLETMKNDDRVKARQRFRVCVTAQRMTCCLMLCKVCEGLIQKHGLNGAETQLKQDPNLWKDLIVKAQTPQLLEAYTLIADSLMENALHFFRDRIENAFTSREYVSNGNYDRARKGKNDSIFERLDCQFTIEQAQQQSIVIKGTAVTLNSVQQMLKNWRKQGLVAKIEGSKYRKL